MNDTSLSKKEAGREKRKKFIGMAKAVDRGQYTHTYNPLKEGGFFVAKSGVPRQIEEGQLFTVLGIESSCDDTGGERSCVWQLVLSCLIWCSLCWYLIDGNGSRVC
jgi:hypothetical protein